MPFGYHKKRKKEEEKIIKDTKRVQKSTSYPDRAPFIIVNK